MAVNSLMSTVEPTLSTIGAVLLDHASGRVRSYRGHSNRIAAAGEAP